jgi:hypothetical protein
MRNGVARQLKLQPRIEEDLREALRQRRVAWMQAPANDRDEERERFQEALRLFSSFVLDGRLPKA